MSYIDRDELKLAPYTGEFYTSVIDRDAPLDQQTETEQTICTVKCDIQQDSHARYGTNIHAVYRIDVPFSPWDGENVPVQRGNLFRGEQDGLPVIGKVIGVFSSQLGGWFAFVESNQV